SPDARQQLLALGWPDDAPACAALNELPAGRIARVSAQHRSGYIVATAIGREFPAQALAAWTRRDCAPENRPAIGDWVLLESARDQIVALLPRRSLLQRAAAGESYRRQPIAANVDIVFVVSGLDLDFNPRRLERYLVLVQASGAQPVLVLTKLDLHADVDADAQLAGIAAQGVPIVRVNAKDPASVSALHPWLGAGRSVVLVGSSGAGKSTLTNTLLGTQKMKTAAVRAHDARGRHTTTHRALIPLPQGGVLIDSPGMRELKPTGEEAIDAGAFDDIVALTAQCRFRDCAHGAEPGCAVRAALDAGTLDPARFANYRKLGAEVAAAAQGFAAQQARRAEGRAKAATARPRARDKYRRGA
ncbi:MAG: ribosome small subunit-dependent GTPase A, partial [Proteobacteria bacterium]|nr:ribosome small subunit-dependent GTPase A [Pseudomonadota bacterium]